MSNSARFQKDLADNKDDGLRRDISAVDKHRCGFQSSCRLSPSGPTPTPESEVKEEEPYVMSSLDYLRRTFAETEILRARVEEGSRQCPEYGKHTRFDHKPTIETKWHKSCVSYDSGPSLDHERLFFPESPKPGKRRSRSRLTDTTLSLEDGQVEEAPPAPPEPESMVEVGNKCRCPIALDCPAKAGDQLDCRTLVLEWKAWATKQDGELRDMTSRNTTAEHEAFATLAEASVIVSHCNNFTLRQAFSKSLRYTLGRMKEWAMKMLERSITQDVLDQSLALPALQVFLSDANQPMRTSKHVPLSIVDDLRITCNKWSRGDLSILPQRGLIHGSNGWVPDKTWPFRQSAKYFGHGQLVVSQIWFSRAALLRDGAHGAIIAGIAGTKGQGARSVVMGCHNGYNKEYYGDVDMGNKIYYMGTALRAENEEDLLTNVMDTPGERAGIDSDDPHGTNATKALFTSLRTGQPIRVFRSFKLAEIVKHRPDKGYRYDGLYRVVGYELMKAERQIYRFEMERLTDTVGPYAQGPIRANVRVSDATGKAKRKRRN